MGILAGCHGCHREGVPPALTAELWPRDRAPVPLAWLCLACAADPPPWRRVEGALGAAFVQAPAPLRIAAVAEREAQAPPHPCPWGADAPRGAS